MKTKLSLLFAVLTATSDGKLAAWYALDESPAADLAVTENIAANNATLIGYDTDPNFSYVTRGVPSARPNLGLAYDLDRTDTAGGGFNLGNAPAVQPTDQFTISFFFQPQFLTTFDRFFESLVGNSNDLHGMRIDTGGSGNQMRVLLRSATGANTQLTHPTVLKTDGTWYFFAFRYDTTAVDTAPFRVTLIEMDGTEIDEAAVAAATSGTAVLNTGAMAYPHEGNSLVGVELPDASNPNNIDTVIDEYAFFDNSDGNGVLSDAQLVNVFHFGPSGVELISSFTSNRSSVSPGNPATFSWTVADGLDSLVLDDGQGNIVDLLPLTTDQTGSTQVSPAETTTYIIRATQGEAANVFPLTVVAGEAPEIVSFTTSAGLIQQGSSADLTWSVLGAETLTLDPAATDVTGETSLTLFPTTTTTYTLTATNPFGSVTAEVDVDVLTGPVPVHRNVASLGGGNDALWPDLVGNRDWTVTGGMLVEPLTTPAPGTTITAAYTTGGLLNGAATATHQYPQVTIEVWFRPGALTLDHEVIYETGGGQNGLAALITESNLRLLGSELNVRTLDATIPLAGLNLENFLQLVITNDADADLCTATLRDTVGNVRTVSEAAAVTIGGNGAGLFTWASGAIAAGHTNLGGRSEAAGVSPEGLTGFAGEIAILNVYDRILNDTEIQQTFSRVASVSTGLQVTSVSFDDATDQITLTWDSVNGQDYLLQFSTSLQSDEWFELAGPFTGTGEVMTQTATLPPNQLRFFVRLALDQP